MRPEEILTRKAFYDERREILWEVEVTPPDSNCFRFLLFTDEYRRAVGVGHDEMAGRLLAEALPPESVPLVQDKYSLCVNFREQITYSEYLNVGGQWRYWRTTLLPRLDDQGRIHRLLGTAIEIVGIEAELRTAIQKGQLTAHYQAICDIKSDPPVVVGYEALIRWPGTGYNPGDFLPVAKKAGLMPDVTQFVLEAAAAHLHATQGQRWIAVNVSDCLTAASLKQVVDKFELKPSWLKLEITEDTEISPELITEYKQILSIGCVFELDDYGTERSNPVWLSQLDINIIKLDAQFVMSAHRFPNKAAVCESAAVLAAKFCPQLDIIAEGIESEDDLAFVRRLGFRYGQGYLLGKPGPIEKWSNPPLRR